MRLDLREIIDVPGACAPFECELDTQLLDFPSVAAYKVPPKAVGEVVNEAGVLRIEAEIRAEMSCLCDRCGGSFDSVKVTKVDSVIVEDGENADPEAFVLDGDGVDLDELLGACFILDMETKFLCKEDCKGLCPRCGKNLNFGPCGCGRQIDPRFAVLRQLLD